MVASLLARAGNGALDVNPSTGTEIHLVTSGSDWYWTVFSLMGATAIGYTVLAYIVPRRERFFHYTSIAAALFSAIAYFTMASNLGWTPVQTEFSHQQDGGLRQVFYARYIGWFMSAPLIILNMAFFAGLNWVTALFMAGVMEVYVISGLVGSVVVSTYKWGYFVFGLCAWVLVFYNLAFVAPQSLNELNAMTVEPKLRNYFRILLAGVGLIYSLYPIAWGLSEGGNVITPTSEGVFYGILDLIALPVLNTMLLFMSRKMDIDELGLGIPEAKPVEQKTVA
ncbi:hypothetical protein V1512DRAFT_266624 [Lipomyces arxii]|uniref:uncharacterized protein n=1 Tax=Lipomyces arxii TaxID=56418 RepID=UPI0034CD927B